MVVKYREKLVYQKEFVFDIKNEPNLVLKVNEL